MDKVIKNRKRALEYYHNNRDEMIKKNKIWKNQNKDHVIETRKNYWESTKDFYLGKVTCDCGSVVCRNGLIRHMKSNKHLEYVLNIN